ncbi:2'-5' RNA ligase family protein [Dyadobacter sp. CY343]|uniref:2'-5' RNA ligase family protein n=1 Tax=Dyadobacter sp. CY343 TaxID=2907299 RepID=UPI001F3C104F|nr:2'-5' RNA ligase family protein [Dyadobacter sp. CY343]MCE7062357.1 hypothetical protein [Dyadobacter sp. CY343]
MKKFNIALTLEQSISEKIIEYAKELYTTLDSNVILGLNSKPHITIGQFSIGDMEAKEVWQNYASLSKLLPKVSLSGLTIIPSSSGGAWIEISVLKSSLLLKLQDDLINILSPFGELTNDVGDNYRPHITIARTTISKEFENLPVDSEVLKLKLLNTELAIGLGTNFEDLIIK